ncbi:VWA domain-containing protein [Terriglobus sp. TAA 43]|uniref:VWA domain-containing protein n=1 Tax=Terriglobus sp. TAA 43 TaxID=278961 RepID=UPI000648BE38|nr:VWA domain-containing protein [Terriglobus sp. TAA 43]
MRYLAFFPMLLLTLPALAQEASVETLHVTSSLVEVSAVVTDKTGEPRTGLTKDDFVLKQDGKEQPIRYFSQAYELPLTFILMIDTSGSQRSFIDDERRACDVFFETALGRPQDRAALVEVNAKITARSELTNSPAKLHLSLAALHFDEKESTATRINDAIWTLSKDVLSKVRGRKAIILISDGGALGNTVSRADAIAEAQRDNVPVYAVDYSAWSGTDMMPQGGIGGLSGVTLAGSAADPGLTNLKEWSVATGGHVYEVTRRTTLKHIFENIAQELRTQYEIGYTLPANTKSKQFHKLELETKDKSLRVQARSGFFTNP